ncbi:AB-hydrolase YheT [Atractiella rhizophila]|nr:AB-hydrolase YheT [Atractiella rhizophila]
MVHLLFHPQPATLLPSSSNSSSNTSSSSLPPSSKSTTAPDEALTLRSHVLSRCPLLTQSNFKPSLLLPNGHFQTLYSAFFRPATTDLVAYRRTILQVPQAPGQEGTGQVALDFALPHPPSSGGDEHGGYDPDTPILVMLHGLSGNSGETYIRDVVVKMRQRWRCVVLHARGCGGTKITNQQFFHGGYTLDLRCTLLYLRSLYPSAPLYAIGFSLGSNILIQYLETEDRTSRGSGLRAAVGLAVPWDFLEGAKYLQATWMRRVYSQAMGENLRHLILQNEESFLNDKRIDIKALRTKKMSRLGEFDALVTAPLGNFATPEDYYVSVTSNRDLHVVRTPLLTLNSMDDPVCPPHCVPNEVSSLSPYTIVGTTPHGGHLGWWEGWGVRWSGKVAAEFLEAMKEVEYARKEDEGVLVAVEGDDGWIYEEGRKEIGFKVVYEGEEEKRGTGEQEGIVGGL